MSRIKFKGRASRWTKEQDKIIDDAIPLWHQFSMVDYKDLPGNNPTLTEWKKSKGREILSHPHFKDSLPSGMTEKIALDIIARKFTNYRHARTSGRVVKDDTGSENGSEDGSLITNFFEKIKPTSGRKIFAEQKSEAIASRRDDLVLATGLAPIAAYQKAVKELWEAEDDRKIWEKMGPSGENIYENQKDLALNMYRLARGICRSGSYGPTEMVILYAFRDSRSNIDFGCIQAHHTEGIPEFTDSAGGRGLDSRFEEWAADVLPRKFAVPREIAINKDGLPVFPTLSLAQESAVTVKQVIQRYLEALWNHCRPSEKVIPWEMIAETPSDYYDTSTYKFQNTLSHPAQIPMMDAYKLAEDLERYTDASTGAGFTFLPTSEAETDLDPSKRDKSPTPSCSSSPPLFHTSATPPRSRTNSPTRTDLITAFPVPISMLQLSPEPGNSRKGSPPPSPSSPCAESTKAASNSGQPDPDDTSPPPILTPSIPPLQLPPALAEQVSVSDNAPPHASDPGSATVPGVLVVAGDIPEIPEIPIPPNSSPLATTSRAGSPKEPTVVTTSDHSIMAPPETLDSGHMDWDAEHPDPGQTFDDTPASSEPMLPDSGGTVEAHEIPSASDVTNQAVDVKAGVEPIPDLPPHEQSNDTAADSPPLEPAPPTKTSKLAKRKAKLKQGASGGKQKESSKSVKLKALHKSSTITGHGQSKRAAQKQDAGSGGETSGSKPSERVDGLRRTTRQVTKDVGTAAGDSHGQKRPIRDVEGPVVLIDGRKGKVTRAFSRGKQWHGGYFLEDGHEEAEWMNDLDNQINIDLLDPPL